MKCSLIFAALLALGFSTLPQVAAAQATDQVTTAPMATATANPMESANPMEGTTPAPGEMGGPTYTPHAPRTPWGLLGLLGLHGLLGLRGPRRVA